jgi:hypothetical protein
MVSGAATRDLCIHLSDGLQNFLGDEPERWLVIGPNRAGNFLELVVLTTAEGNSWSSMPCLFGPSTGGS